MKGIEAWNSVPFCRASNVTGELDGGLYPLITWKLCSAQVRISSESDGGPNPLIILKGDLLTSCTCCWTRASSCMHISLNTLAYMTQSQVCIAGNPRALLSIDGSPPPESSGIYNDQHRPKPDTPVIPIISTIRSGTGSEEYTRKYIPVSVVCEWLQCASGTRNNPIQWSVGIINLNPSSVISENWWNSE